MGAVVGKDSFQLSVLREGPPQGGSFQFRGWNKLGSGAGLERVQEERVAYVAGKAAQDVEAGG
jgi:hypothetical protein